ncbi:IS3 family transposase [Variovorax paradoxus]
MTIRGGAAACRDGHPAPGFGTSDKLDGLNTTRKEKPSARLDRIHWYNEKRIKLSLGSLSPIEYRESLGFAT